MPSKRIVPKKVLQITNKLVSEFWETFNILSVHKSDFFMVSEYQTSPVFEHSLYRLDIDGLNKLVEKRRWCNLPEKLPLAKGVFVA